MEDADSPVKRKRPRLDSGDRAYRSMSAEPSSTIPSASRGPLSSPDPNPNEEARYSNTDTKATSASSPSAAPARAMDMTPSKVTINVRDPSLAGSPTQPQFSNPAMSDDNRNEASGNHEGPTASESNDLSPPTLNPSSPSSMGSPRIEVAEPEYMDDAAGPTVWIPATANGTAGSVVHTQEALLRDFPFMDQTGTALGALGRVFEDFSEGLVLDMHVVTQLAGWLEAYLHATRSCPSQWFELNTSVRRFWETLPKVIQSVMTRHNFRNTEDLSLLWQEEGNGHKQNPVVKLMESFAAMTARILQIDVNTFEQTSDDTASIPDLCSFPWIEHFNKALNERVELWRLLRVLKWDTDVILDAMIYSFGAPPGQGFGCISRFITLALDRTLLDTDLIYSLFRLATLLLDRWKPMAKSADENGDAVRPAYNVPQAIVSMFRSVNEKLQYMITKQASSLTVDILSHLINHIGTLFRSALACDSSLAEDMLPKGYELDSQGLDGSENFLTDRTALIEYAWRMELYKKCIIHGRMDSRITGVESMQQCLVEVWRRYIQASPEGPYHVVVEYLADFILKSKLVHYLVGVESHPQIIPRSKNIIGFLVVTHKYTDEQTDLIWNSVLSSQDPRAVEAILEMLKGILELSTIPLLVYLCQKINDLPVSAFDAKMTMYCAAVTSQLIRLWRGTLGASIDLTPYWLMVRLARQSTAEPGLPIGRRRELWNFATPELRQLMQCRIDDKDKLSIYEESLNDVRAASAAAAASTSTVVVLLESHADTEIVRIDQFFDIASLMVEDMSHLRELETAAGIRFHDFLELMGDRLRLVQKVVVHLPDTLTGPLRRKLWESLVGQRALSDTTRDMAWNHLANSVQHMHRRNSFFDSCLHELLPALDPKFLTMSVLEFANQLTEYNARMSNAMSLEPGSPDDSIRGEIFRHIALRVPKKEIGERAICFFVRFNLEDLRTRGLSRAFGAERQKKLVDSCVEHLKGAAAKLKRLMEGSAGSEEDSMVIVPSEDEVSAVKLSFVRTFAILKDFMDNIRAQQPNSPQIRQMPNQGPQPLGEGEMRVQYQPHVGGKPTGIFSLNIAETSTVGSLAERLRSSTGFSEFTLIAGGSRIGLDAQKDRPLQDMKTQLAGLLLVQKTPGSKSIQGNGAVPRLLPLENEVMNHFHELYEFLSIDDDLGNDVFKFLTTFPPHEEVMATVSVEDQEWSNVFPAHAPYKAMYSVCALKGVLSQALQEGAPCQQLVCHGIRLLSNALMNAEVPESGALSGTEALVTQSMADCLLQFLKEPNSEQTKETYFEDPSSIIKRLGLLISAGLAKLDSDTNVRMVCACFASILEASLHNRSFWSFVRNDHWTPTLLEKLWLHVPRENVRKSCVDSLKSILSSLSSAASSSPPDFIPYFWDQVVALVPRAIENHGRSKQFFEVAVEIFRRLDPDARDALPFRSYLMEWSELLLSIKHDEFRPQASVETVISGLGELLNWCMKTWKAKKAPIEVPEGLMERIFVTHLFTPLVGRAPHPRSIARLPVLDSRARGNLYGLLLALSTNLSKCRKLLTMTKALLPERESSAAWSHGIAQIGDDTQYELAWNFDRWKAIRSSTGYVGLKNLSNTCYMNSLLTQLFMNAKFRDFILTTHLTDPEGSQKLLAETKTLFAYLQETWLKAVDPENVTNQIVTYEGAPIDILIQMDVDEFYNLLFDRWESQILSNEAKKEFRQFYGGQLVQQIKSRDCEHVSERTEPFSAIQCEIQGKSSLVDSLNAYVEGEMMEGDNKYSCSSCGSYVNAVKRACLKDIPDSLIFHLKRFDYDLMTGMRNKINEHFEFPRDIDMTPYTVDYLKDPQQKPVPDRFTLVGVLVHSGNAEAGHYYSYIRERPHSGDSWVEFNDADVTPFDPINLRDQCFGGWTEQPYAGVHYPKTWSAYMLFYQRVSAMEAEEAHHRIAGKSGPAKVDIPVPLANRLSTENEHWIRRFCLFDPEHARFSKDLLEQFRDFTKDLCSDDHVLESDVIGFILQHLERIFCRQKDVAVLHAILDTLTRLVDRCGRCCRIFLDGVMSGEMTLRTFLLRCPDETMKRKTAAMIAQALKFLRANAPRLYGFDVEGSESDSSLESDFGIQGGALLQCIDVMKSLQHMIYYHWKAWDDYFGLLVGIASLGRPECIALHEAGFLEYCLQVLIIDSNKYMQKHWPNMGPFVKLSEKRKFSMRKLVALVQILLGHVSRGDDSYLIYSDESHQAARKGFMLSEGELNLIKWTGQTERHADRDDRGLHFLDRILRVDNVDIGVCQEIIRILLRLFDGDKPFTRKVLVAIHQGCTIEPAVLAKPHLNAALAFCETCAEPTLCKQAVERFAKEVQSINLSGGEEHIDFFERVRRLQNEHFSTARPSFFKLEALKVVPHFAPHLLIYPDATVRSRTAGLITILILNQNTTQMDDERMAEAIDAAGHGLLKGMLELLQTLVRQSKPIEVSRAEDFANAFKRCYAHCMPDTPGDAAAAGDAQTNSEPAPHSLTWRRLRSAQLNDRVVVEWLEQLMALTVASPDEALSGEYDSCCDGDGPAALLSSDESNSD